MNPRLLVAVVEGVGAPDIDPALTPFLAGAACRAPLHRTSGLQPARELLAGGLVQALRELGLEVERRSIVLRRAWHGDTAVLAQLERRPRGAADITFLRLADVARAVAETGSRRAQRLVLAQLDTRLARVCEALERGRGRTEAALLCVGPMLPTARNFDPVQHLRRLPRALLRQVRYRLSPGALGIECASVRAEVQLRNLLQRHPFDGHGSLSTDDRAGLRPGQLMLLAKDGVSFGQRRVRARLPCLPHGSAADGVALLPWQEPGETSIPRVAAHILRRGRAMVRTLTAGKPSPVGAAADIDAVLEHDPLHVVER